MTDYEQFLSENGPAKADMDRGRSDALFIPLDRFERKRVRRGPSKIEGEGIFAVTDHLPDVRLADAKHGDEWTEAGRYMNHSPNPNCAIERDGDDLFFSSMWEVASGEELTVNYRDMKKP